MKRYLGSAKSEPITVAVYLEYVFPLLWLPVSIIMISETISRKGMMTLWLRR